MKLSTRLILLLALLGLLLGGCSSPIQSGPLSFDGLARWVPGEVSQAYFLNLKLEGQAGVYWQRIRDRLEANREAQPLLASLLSQFSVPDLGLDTLIAGPVANWNLAGIQYYAIQVNSQSAARDAILLQDKRNTAWSSDKYQGWTLYHRSMHLGGQPLRLAFTIHDDLLLVATDYTIDPVDKLKTLADLSEQDSLASRPLWQTLYARLPQSPMGLIFAQQTSTPDTTPSLSAALGQQIEGLAVAAVPEKEGMRVDIAGSINLQGSAPPEIHDLLASSGVDPASWAGLPVDTAVVISGHDAAIIWPILTDIVGTSLGSTGDQIGLNIETDLLGTNGPLRSDFCAALLPPLPDQPISQGLPAGQLLFLGRGTSATQAAALGAAMESHGAVLKPGEIQGMPVQTQVGTELTGYAISFGARDQDLFLGTSPGAIEQSLQAQAAGNGLVTTAAFQAMIDALPRQPTFFFFLNRPSLTAIARANMTEKQYSRSQELVGLEAFEAIGLGLKLGTETIDGTLYFLIQ